MRALLGLHLRIIFLCCATSSFLSFKIHKHSKLVSTQNSHRVGSCLYGSAVDEDDDSDPLGIQPDFFKSGFVSILGNPNVGKSTLMNAILREKLCIVSPKPQTTRHRILGVVTENDHQLVFSDTPGMLEPVYKLQEAMMDSVRGAAGDADIILLVTDVYGEDLVDKRIMQKLQATNRTILVVINKIDMLESSQAKIGTSNVATGRNTTPIPRKSLRARLFAKSSKKIDGASDGSANATEATAGDAPKSLEELTKLWNTRLPKAEILPISAANRVGIDTLMAKILENTQEGPKYFPADTLTTRDERFFATEIIRECLLLTFRDEIPYSCEVVIESFQDKSPALSVIEANIVVSRESQKAIVIGKAGTQLKQLGIAARKRLEEFLERKVFLSLHVKVDEDWRGKPEALQRYGYIDSDFG